MLTQENKNYLGLTELEYAYIETLLGIAFSDGKVEGMKFVQNIYDPS